MGTLNRWGVGLLNLLASEDIVKRDGAVQIAIHSIEKKGLAFWEPKRSVVCIHHDDVHKVYFPYFIMEIYYKANTGPIKWREARQLMAMEGLTGQVGAVIGIPCARTVGDPDAKIISPVFTDEEAANRITDYMKRYFVRTKRLIPEILHSHIFTLYKPAYIAPLDFKVKGRVEHARKVVDAESGYLVYRYDRYKEL